MSQIGSRIPITGEGGYQEVFPDPSGWTRLVDLCTIPAEATGALIYSLNFDGIQTTWALAPDAVLGSGLLGIPIAQGGTLELDNASQVQQFCVQTDLNAAFTIQFFTGPVGRLPKLSAPPGTGGGGGGTATIYGVAPVHAYDTGDNNFIVELNAGNAGTLLQYNADDDTWHLAQGLESNVLYVDYDLATIDGLDPERNNPHRPYVLPQLAVDAAQAGDTIIVRSVPLQDNDTTGKDGVNWFLIGQKLPILITDGGDAMSFSISGPGSMKTTFTGDIYAAVRLTNADSHVTIRVDLYSLGTNYNPMLYTAAGIIEMHGNLYVTSAIPAQAYGGIIEIHGNIYTLTPGSEGLDVYDGGTIRFFGRSTGSPRNKVRSGGRLEISGYTDAKIDIDSPGTLVLLAGARVVTPPGEAYSITGDGGTATCITYGSFSNAPIDVAYVTVVGMVHTAAAWVD